MLLVLACVVALAIVALVAMARYNRRRVLQLEERIRAQKASLEEQVEKAEDLAKMKSDFLSRMSHEIRTPLNSIIGMAQIARNVAEANKVKECMNRMEESSKHLLGIVNDILDFSKIESANLELEEKLFSLGSCVSFVTSMFQAKTAEKGIRLRVDADDIQHDGIVTDMLRLNQVLINLLSNAIKFTDQGGEVTLTVHELAHLEGDSMYLFSVRDTGVGIEPEQARKLFTPFMQANAGVARIYGGTGLGLSIAQSIVRMMGGDIELETELGKGSEFSFTIRVPAMLHAEEEGAAEPIALHKDLSGKRIMIVDDIDINREVVAEMLADSGLTIETATNGKEALDAFLSSPPNWYDLILMDMQMPVMDGCAATQEIRDSGRPDASSIHIAAMTANVMREDVDHAFACGMDGYLSKPIDMEEMYQRMEEWL